MPYDVQSEVKNCEFFELGIARWTGLRQVLVGLELEREYVD